ncbi:MAG: HD domain-containing phosphohydrolase [Candidatus Bruticola sp.]
MDSLFMLAAAAKTSVAAGSFMDGLNWLQILSGAMGGAVLAIGGGALLNAVSARMAPPVEIPTTMSPSSIDTRRWEALPALIGKLTKSSEPNQVFRVILESTKEQMGCEYCALLILRGNTYQFEAGIGLCEESRQAFKLDAKNGLVDFMRTKAKSVALNRTDRQLQEFNFLREPISEVIVTPMRTGDNIFALLFVANKANMGNFKKEDFDMMGFLTMPFALALYQAITFKRAQGGIVNTIVEIITNYEKNMPGCEGHSERVARMAEAMGRELRMNENELEVLRAAALLHDLGKFSMPSSLRFCESLPAGPERELVLNQDKAAVMWLKPLGFVERSLPLILHHHERYDGSGFPAGMRGPAIPLGAMVIAVAETFDLLTHDRPDQSRRDPMEVKAYIESLANSKFDPQVIRAFNAIMEKGVAS